MCKTALIRTSLLKRNEGTFSKKKIKIFLVDDEPDIALTYKVGLEQNGFSVDLFNDPLQALSSFRTGSYDLLLLDIKMPKMNGFELFREIRTVDEKVKVCFITAFVSYYESLVEMFRLKDVRCFIKKPVDIWSLAQRIRAEITKPSFEDS